MRSVRSVRNAGQNTSPILTGCEEDALDADLRGAVERRLAERVAEARWRRALRERARAEKQERRDAGLRARHAAKLHRTESQT